jgi:hypothetical protein
VWQDYVIASVIVMFALTTLPLIKNRIRVPLWTAIPMVVGSVILAITYVSLDLWFSLTIEIVCAILWSTVLSISLKDRHVLA